MDEDTEGIEALIEQRNQRHGYARMISWEFPTNPVPHRKKRKSGRNKSGENVQSEEQLQTLDVENQSVLSTQSGDFESDQSLKETQESESDSLIQSDSDSYYVSAEEDVDDDDSDMEGNLSRLSYMKLKGLEDLDFGTSSNNQEDSGPRTSDHQKAPSKKQKRKARQSYKILYGDKFLPFKDIEFELDVTEVQSQDLDVTVMKQVPTLVELCLRASSKKTIQGSMPFGIRNILKESQLDKATRNHQISWFQGILAYCEAQFEQQYTHKVSGFKNEQPVDVLKILKPLRNIWNSEYYLKHKPNYYMVTPAYNGSKESSYLLCTHIMQEEWIKLPFNYNEKESLYLITYCLFGVLACLVDLMMPPVVAADTKKKSVNEEAQMARSVKRIALRVKHVIRSRFPKIVDHLFNDVLPYVYWARGNLPSAVESFTELAQNDKRCRYKALYLSEIGRMYAQYSLLENATKSYRLAAEVATQKNQKYESEVNGQMMILCGNVYDQGLMTATKGKLAISMWKSVLFCPDVQKEDVVNVLVDSMLCFHSGCWPDYDSQWLESARDQLTSLTSTCPQLFYPLSMVYALLGDEANAEKTYQQFHQRGLSTGAYLPGSEQMKKRHHGENRKRHPWDSLISLVSTRSTPKTIQVVWRVQLQPFRVNITNGVNEATMISQDLNLRLSEEGDITGDMQTYLPPMRGVYLNPYTGSITHNHNPGKTESWQSFISRRDKLWLQEMFLIPTLMQLYSDKHGNTVHIFMPRDGSVVNVALHNKSLSRVTTLYWSGANGQRAKFSVVTKLKNHIYQKLAETIESKAETSKGWKKKMMKILQKFYDKSWIMNMHELERFYKHQEEADANKKQDQELKHVGKSKVRKTKFRSENRYNSTPFGLEFQDVPICYGKMLLLPLRHPDKSDVFLVFVDCNSKEAFQNPVIHSNLNYYKNKPDNLQKNSLPCVNRLYLQVRQSQSCFNIFDETGKFLKETTEKEMTVPRIHQHFIINDMLLYTSEENDDTLYCYCNEVSMSTIKYGNIRCVTAMYDVLVVNNAAGVMFCNPRNLLPITVKLDTYCKGSGCLNISDDNEVIQGPFDNDSVTVLSVTEAVLDGVTTNRVFLALDCYLLYLSVPVDTPERPTREITVMLAIELPGKAKGVCEINKNVGFVVTWTQHPPDSKNYREHLFHFDFKGTLIQVLPYLGRGSRSFLPVYLPGDPYIHKNNPEHGKSGWYLYMRDGHEGIIGAYLSC